MRIDTLLNILENFKIDLVLLAKSSSFDAYKKAEKALDADIDKYEKKNLKGNPIYDSIDKKKMECDWEHGKCPSFTADEKKFMNSAEYQQWEKMEVEKTKVLDDVVLEIKKRLKNGTADDQEKKALDNAEIKIWKKASDYFKRKTENDLPLITFDGVFYEILNGYYGWSFSSVVTEKLSADLKQIGCYYEHYDASTWIIVSEDPSKFGGKKKGKEPAKCPSPSEESRGIAEAIKKANEAGLAEASKYDDLSGSCNLDSLVVAVPEPLDANAADIERRTGMHVYVNERDGTIGISAPGPWQGAKRTAWCEGAAKKLEELGFKAHVKYVMD